MPKLPVPPAIDAFLRAPNPCVSAQLRPDGSPHTAATWYDWEGGRVLLNLDAGRKRLAYLRRDPRVSLTVLGADSWYRHVSLLGRVVSIEDDPDMVDIDRLAARYTGRPYRNRERPRVSVWIQAESWHAWDGGRPWRG